MAADQSPTEPAAGPAPLREGSLPRVEPRILLLKALVLLALAVGGALLARTPGVREWLDPAGRLAPVLRDLGWTAMPVFVLGSMFLISLGVPRLLFCPLAGAAFGFTGGMVSSTVATMGAYLLTFVFIRGRLAGREDRFEIPERLAFLRRDPGIAGVITARLLPIPGLIGTIALGVSPVRLGTFAWGSLLGLLPEAAPLVLLGAGLLNGNPRRLAWLGAGAVVLILGCFLVMRRALRGPRSSPRGS